MPNFIRVKQSTKFKTKAFFNFCRTTVHGYLNKFVRVASALLGSHLFINKHCFSGFTYKVFVFEVDQY